MLYATENLTPLFNLNLMSFDGSKDAITRNMHKPQAIDYLPIISDQMNPLTTNHS